MRGKSKRLNSALYELRQAIARAERLLVDCKSVGRVPMMGSEAEREARKISVIVAAKFGVPAKLMFQRCRTARMALARQTAMAICLDKLRVPKQQIGQLFRRDVSTVVYSTQVVADLAQVDKDFQKDYAACRLEVEKQLNPS